MKTGHYEQHCNILAMTDIHLKIICIGCTQLGSCLKHYTTNRRVAGSIPMRLFSLTSCFRPHYGSGFDSTSNTNEY